MAISFKVLDSPIKFGVAASAITMGVQPAAVVYTGGSTYDGAYSVTPQTWEETVLPTKKKVLIDDVTVRKIPQYEVSNDSGGCTLIIGDEDMQ